MIEWTQEEKEALKRNHFTVYVYSAYFGPHKINKEMSYRYVNNVREDFIQYEAVTESLERDVDGEVGPTWTYLGYTTLEDAMKRVRGTLIHPSYGR